MSDGLTPATAIFSDRGSGNARGGKMRLMRDERGLIGWIAIAVVGLIAFMGLGGSSVIGIDWGFFLAISMILVVGLAVFGMAFKGLQFKFVIIIAVLCMAIALFFTITPVVILGFVIVGFAMWKFTPEKHIALLVGMIGVGLLLVVWGTAGLATLGIYP